MKRTLSSLLVLAAALFSGLAAWGQSSPVFDPVAHHRQAKSWEFGPFASYGNGIGDRSSYKFLTAGFQAGKPLSRVLRAGPFSGQFEYGANIMPLWQAYTPAPHTVNMTCNASPCVLPFGGGTYRGLSLTPVILRWNFATRSRRIQPWFQAAGGLLYTTRPFPPSFSSTDVYKVDGKTSVWNFMPQGGLGVHYFTAANRSIDLGLNAVHISSASLGDKNPGVNAMLQVQLGYTFWR